VCSHASGINKERDLHEGYCGGDGGGRGSDVQVAAAEGCSLGGDSFKGTVRVVGMAVFVFVFVICRAVDEVAGGEVGVCACVGD